jgi:VanZ family protein
MDLSSRPPNAPRPIAGFLRYWLPVLIWMAVVFSASADSKSYHHSSILFEPLMRWLFPHMSMFTLEQLHHVFRKTCHLGEYAVFAWLVWRAIRRPVRNDLRAWNWAEAGLAMAVVFAYAASDELHQAFVPSRTALVSDVFVDSSGGLVCLLLLWLRYGGAAWLWRKMVRAG